MNRIRMSRLFPVVLIILASLSVFSAFAANIDVPDTFLTDQVQAITANSLKPSACAAFNLRRIEFCDGGICNASGSNDLIIGTAGYDDIRGKNGDDCILGGGGNDDISGDNGTDVCIGGPGNEAGRFDGSCETQIEEN